MYAKCHTQYRHSIILVIYFSNAKPPYTTVKGVVTIPTEVHDIIDTRSFFLIAVPYTQNQSHNCIQILPVHASFHDHSNQCHGH